MSIEKDNRDPEKDLTSVNINGDLQWIFVRGNNTQHSVILFLHGGPGFSQMSFASYFYEELAEHFLVVDWNQRGSGKSYKQTNSEHNITFNDYIDDTITLSKWLLKEYQKEKIYLVGHSWGCTLGLYVIKKCPELFSGFIGTGFGVDYQEGEKLSVQYLLDMAKKSKDLKAIKALGSIKFPITDDTFDSYIRLKSKYMNTYGGYFKKKVSFLLRKVIKPMVLRPIYRVSDYFAMMKGIKAGREVGKKVLLNINIMKDLPILDVPLYFFIGRYDYHTPYEMTKVYYDKVSAPYKEWVWFENSAHSPIFEESEKFSKEIIRIVEENDKKMRLTPAST